MGDGLLLDLMLVAGALLFGLSGYKQGVIVGALSFGGFVGGGFLGLLVAPAVAASFTDGPGRTMIALALVLSAACIGQLLGTTIGRSLRDRLTWHPARLFDALTGAVVSAVGLLLFAWAIGAAVKDSRFAGLARQVNNSRVLTAVDGVLPPAPEVFAPFKRIIDPGDFPQVFNDIGRDTANVPAPDPRLANSRAVTVGRRSTVKILGVARSCSRRLEGTGFVYARERVMTNAHVVAGVTSPEVVVETSRGEVRHRATVVVYDPGSDVAVLYVPRLDLPALSFAGEARSGADAVVIGYPEDGPFNASAARIRERITATGRDIYQRRNVRRDVYSLRARVRPGNSGGPLLAPDGRVYGVIFAAAADDPNTGYALTAEEVADSARQGRSSTNAVSTQRCD